ncbi:hypothetical protein BAUCODRAFT_123962 [Baudoinia panamericana UAMH 10762]|uniref:Uncharacterized protein n=1 Tax=Baudoinia panamericana (strain UAMH 10762) TaxID=717646 RepID=M2LJA9_BAUPA|nr:uncharacterized protein BAUCODRAFT_123962 [Baudoinia panamericana UAMH 10762]EMC94322.1 hypothetical protein BAUCODRAFT_123962 [Baudoinia panamericana UAMH 10762]
MSLPLQALLRLPSCLRTQAFAAAPKPWPTNYNLQKTNRAFSCKSKLLQKLAKQISRQPPAFKKPTTSSSPKSPSRGANPARPPSRAQQQHSYTEQLLGGRDEVLLYKAPNHRSYYVTSYVCGGIFVLWALVQSSIVGVYQQMNESNSWGKYVLTAITMGTSLIAVTAGMFMIMAPVGVIWTITLRSVPLPSALNGAKTPMLRFQMRRLVPLLKPQFVEVEPPKALLDRVVTAQDIAWTSVPLTEASAFTRTAQLESATPGGGLFQNIRRIAWREGFARVYFENHGTWKLDLQGCTVLDHGKPLDRLMGHHDRLATGVWGRLKQIWSA